MRVFHRCIHTGGCQCEPPVTHSDSKCVTCAMPPTFQCGGVGEVCVLPSHRRRGLATDLLRMAIDYMAACGMDVSSLHAAKLAQPMYVQRRVQVYPVVCVRPRSTALNAFASRYARLGWQSVTLDYCTLPIPARPITSAYVCEIAECGSAKATPLLELASKWSHQLACRVRGVCACDCVCACGHVVRHTYALGDCTRCARAWCGALSAVDRRPESRWPLRDSLGILCSSKCGGKCQQHRAPAQSRGLRGTGHVHVACRPALCWRLGVQCGSAGSGAACASVGKLRQVLAGGRCMDGQSACPTARLCRAKVGHTGR